MKNEMFETGGSKPIPTSRREEKRREEKRREETRRDEKRREEKRGCCWCEMVLRCEI